MRRGFKLSTDITINTGLLVVESSNIDCWDDILNAVGDVSRDRVFINVPVCGFKTVLESGNGFLTRFFPYPGFYHLLVSFQNQYY